MNIETDQKPSVARLTYNYTRALFRWIKAGRPVREENEIIKIFETTCKQCEAFEEENSSCQHCGCRVNTKKVAPLNKIAMTTEECPLAKW